MPKTAAQMVAEANAQVKTIAPKDAAVEGVSDKVVFLDVREPVEWEHHIEGAVQVPLACSSSPRTRRVPDTNRNSTRPVG